LFNIIILWVYEIRFWNYSNLNYTNKFQIETRARTLLSKILVNCIRIQNNLLCIMLVLMFNISWSWNVYPVVGTKMSISGSSVPFYTLSNCYTYCTNMSYILWFICFLRYIIVPGFYYTFYDIQPFVQVKYCRTKSITTGTTTHRLHQEYRYYTAEG